jgi:nucleotide-binding universal stress UspA family protein
MRATSATAPIVVGVDGSPAGLQAVKWAAVEAKRQAAPLRLVHALPRLPRNPYPTTARYISELRAAAEADGVRFLVEARAAATDAAGGVDVSEVQHMGSAAEVIGRESAAGRMVVIGATGRSGLTDLMIGSTALSLPASSHAPVVISRKRDDGLPADSGPVVVAVSGSELDEAPLEFAYEYAAECGADLVAVHAWSDAALPEFDRVASGPDVWKAIEEREKRLLSESLAGYSERYPDVEVSHVIAYDRPAEALVDWSSGARLVVMGTRGRGPLTGAFLGSTSRAVGKSAHCPVAIVRQID